MSNQVIESIYQEFKTHHTVYTDSRRINGPGIFFALSGPNFNGNQFAVEAIQKGASLAVVNEKRLKNYPFCILVDNPLKTLQQLAILHRKKLDIPILAITGTNGKTTTKELVFQVLSSKYQCSATKGNLNNHIGVPLTILAINDSTELAIVEMGAGAKGEIAFLCQIAQPTHGLITNIGTAHLAGFKTLETIRQTKAELYHHLNNNHGIFFKNTDEPSLDYLKDTRHIVRFGSDDDCDIVVQSADSTGNLSSVRFKFDGKWYQLTTNLFGEHNTQNIKVAVAVGIFFGLDPDQIVSSLAGYSSSNNRSQIVELHTNRIILDAYNANPSSMNAVLDYVMKIEAPKKVLVLGDMLELGPESFQKHQEIVDKIKGHPWEKVLLVGKQFMQTKADFAEKFPDVQTLKKSHNIKDLNNCLILLKASRGIALEKWLEA